MEQSLPPAPKTEPPYFSVSLLKLALLAVTTFGLYELYWMYQNWKIIRTRQQKDVVPFPFARAVFAIIFVYPLFKAMRETIDSHDPEAQSNPLYAGRLAILWIVITLLYKLPDPWWFVSMFSFIPLLVVQSRINKLNELMSPGTIVNSKFTWANWIWIVVGGLLVILAIIGSMMPDTD